MDPLDVDCIVRTRSEVDEGDIGRTKVGVDDL
jgi:hypothetical protein